MNRTKKYYLSMWIIGVQPDSNRYHGVWNPAMLPLHHELRGDTENRTRGAWFQTMHVTTTTYLQGNTENRTRGGQFLTDHVTTTTYSLHPY